MKQTTRIQAIGAALGMLLLILDGKTALSGAAVGLELCMKSVIPALFPFFVLSGMLTGSFSRQSGSLIRPFGALVGIPSGSEILLLTGLLGGYPVGARCVGQATRSGSLSPEDSRRMMAFCNNAGPSFIFGIAAGLFPDAWYGWLLWTIQIISALTVGALLPGKSHNEVLVTSGRAIGITDALAQAIRSIATVCGWVILFRIVLAFLNRWLFWVFPAEFHILLFGVFELTNGCLALNGISNMGLRFLLAAGFLSFGGLCVAMQTFSEGKGMDMSWYFPGKCLQTAVSLWLAAFIQPMFPAGLRLNIPLPILAVPVLIALPVMIFCRIREKSSSIPGKAIV